MLLHDSASVGLTVAKAAVQTLSTRCHQPLGLDLCIARPPANTYAHGAVFKTEGL